MILPFCDDTRVDFTNSFIRSSTVPGFSASASVTINSLSPDNPSIERNAPGMPCPVQSAVIITAYLPQRPQR